MHPPKGTAEMINSLSFFFFTRMNSEEELDHPARATMMLAIEYRSGNPPS